jgi:hypothetical protein
VAAVVDDVVTAESDHEEVVVAEKIVEDEA